MLRIERNENDGDRTVLILHGRIAGAWADLLESECSAASASGRPLALDFTDVAFVGRSGLDALARLTRAGVVIVGCPPLIADTLEHDGIDAGRRDDDRDDDIDGTTPAPPKVSS